MEPNGNEAEALFREEERSAATAVKQPFETSVALSSPAQMIAMNSRSSDKEKRARPRFMLTRQLFLIENYKLTESEALERKMG